MEDVLCPLFERDYLDGETRRCKNYTFLERFIMRSPTLSRMRDNWRAMHLNMKPEEIEKVFKLIPPDKDYDWAKLPQLLQRNLFK